MPETTQEEKKNTVIKTLAIIGFIVGLILAVWLAVQAVRLLPAAFSTLASIADGLGKDDESEFSIATDDSIVNSGEPLTLSWTQLRTDGTYTFSYACIDGISATMLNRDGEAISIGCDTEVPLPEDQNHAAVTFMSEKTRFADVHYTIAFAADKKDLSFSRNAVVTLVNTEISANGTHSTSVPDSSSNTDGHTPSSRPATSSSEPAGYITVPKVVTSYPVSNPIGFSDLEVTFLGVGTESGNRFSARTSLNEGEDGAMQFAVRNIGTKTSDTWYFSAELPTDPSFTYSSTAQAGLRPNERQVITLSFKNVSDARSERIDIRATGGNDTRLGNNSFSQRIDIR